MFEGEPPLEHGWPRSTTDDVVVVYDAMTGKECAGVVLRCWFYLAPNGKVLSACSNPSLSAKRVCILNHWFLLNI
jgi:hypothetical protein